MEFRDQLPAAQARVLVALLRLYGREGYATSRAVAIEAGYSPSFTYTTLGQLRNAGLVDWAEGKTGTLRPLVAVHRIAA